MKTDIEDRKLIKELPIFNGLNESCVREIMQNSQVKNYKKKGEAVFYEGDKAVNFYVVLLGWVKLFQINEQGKESILQMVGAGESILENVALFNNNFSAMAQTAAKNTKILSISAAHFCEHLKNNQLIATNTLSIMARQSQRLMRQLSYITLKTPRQRVGSFLLNLFLQHNQKPNSIKLPYDKSLIASYLGMRLETFSRSLCELKQSDKIIIKNNVITLSNSRSLCCYCDNENSNECATRCQSKSFVKKSASYS